MQLHQYPRYCKTKVMKSAMAKEYMKRAILAFLLVLMANAASSQTLIVYGVNGKVEDVTGGKSRLVKVRDVLEHSTMLKIPENSYIVLFDKDNKKSFTLERSGTATVKSMIADDKNTIQELTTEFVSFLWKQIKGGGQVLVRNCSDAATVTRDMKIAKQGANDNLVVCGTKNDYSDFAKAYQEEVDNMWNDFDNFTNSLWEDYEAFKDSLMKDYANFVRNPWKEEKLQPAEEKPKDEKIEPIVIELKDGKPIIPDFGNKEKTSPKVTILPLPQPKPLPQVVAPVKQNEELTEQYHTFKFFGTDMKVRWSDDCAFQLKSLKEKAIADAITLLSDKKYENVLYDFLQLRSTYHLNDWAYYQMLKEGCASLCGKGTNEATLLHGMMYALSGYKLRFAKSKDKLLLMVSTQFHLYGYSYLEMDGDHYYLLDGEEEIVDFCGAKFPKEQEMSLIMTESPRFSDNKSTLRPINSPAYSGYNAEVSVNKNLIDYYSSYPSSYFNNNFMTRWAMYANTEMQPEVKQQLYPQLKKMIEGKSKVQAAECILNWIQTGFKYEYDTEVWGYDRAFFAEETLFYPSCDCEDRSILFTRLIRDLLGLKCILVYYPGHLASGVCFNEEVKGEYIDAEGERFTVCDPTFVVVDENHNIVGGARVGESMNDNSTATVIILE